jgi:hypothetical protein
VRKTRPFKIISSCSFSSKSSNNRSSTSFSSNRSNCSSRSSSTRKIRYIIKIVMMKMRKTIQMRRSLRKVMTKRNNRSRIQRRKVIWMTQPGRERKEQRREFWPRCQLEGKRSLK